jgi:diketogulonate reductase-like aldo/keto reductase
MTIDRRDFISLCGGILASSMMTRSSFAQVAPMTTRAIPVSGERLPLIGLGTYQAFDVSDSGPDYEQASSVLTKFHELGGRLVDSSPMYGSAEKIIGSLSQSNGLNDKLFLATKVWTSGKQSGIAQMQQSFDLLRRRKMDLLQVHNLLDLDTHIATLKEWKQQGRVRYIGASHYLESAHDDLEQAIKKHHLDFIQVNYSLAEPGAADRLLPAAAAAGTAVVINRPFAQGSIFREVRGKALPPIAKELQCASWAQFFLKYIAGHPAVTCVIPATRKPEHLADNMQAGIGPLPDTAQRAEMRKQFLAL